jgi:hypothetical protein
VTWDHLSPATDLTNMFIQFSSCVHAQQPFIPSLDKHS